MKRMIKKNIDDSQDVEDIGHIIMMEEKTHQTCPIHNKFLIGVWGL